MLNDSRCLWMDGRECGGSTEYLDFCSLLISFCDERYTLSDCKWPQKPKNTTQISFKGHNGVPRVG